MAFHSLNQRLSVLLLLPVGLILLGAGAFGFFSIRDNLLAQNRGQALLNLARAAHALDMRLSRPAQAVELLGQVAPATPLALHEWEAALSRLPGVERVELRLTEGEPGTGRSRGKGMGMGFSRARVAAVGSPQLAATGHHQSVAMTFDLLDPRGEVLGSLRLVLDFDSFLDEFSRHSGWAHRQGFLVEADGRILACSDPTLPLRQRLGDNGDPLELATLAALAKSPSGTLLGPGYPAEAVSGFHRLELAPWTLVVIAPGREALGAIFTFMRAYLAVALGAILLIVVLIRLVTGQVARPVDQVARAARRVAEGDYAPAPAQPGADEIARLVADFNLMVEGLRERDLLRDTFGRYVDREVARKLIAQPEAGRLGGQKRTVAILISDIRGFTSMCECLPPERTVELINRYLSGLIEVIHGHQGIIVDFLGDAVLAFFDTLEASPAEAARRAARCALELMAATRRYNAANRELGQPELLTAVGLHAGEVVVGNLGSKTRTKYGILGAPVNLAHRIQAQADGGEVLASAGFVALLDPPARVGRSFRARLKGFEEEVELFALLGWPEDQEALPGSRTN